MNRGVMPQMETAVSQCRPETLRMESGLQRKRNAERSDEPSIRWECLLVSACLIPIWSSFPTRCTFSASLLLGIRATSIKGGTVPQSDWKSQQNTRVREIFLEAMFAWMFHSCHTPELWNGIIIMRNTEHELPHYQAVESFISCCLKAKHPHKAEIHL